MQSEDPFGDDFEAGMEQFLMEFMNSFMDMMIEMFQSILDDDEALSEMVHEEFMEADTDGSGLLDISELEKLQDEMYEDMGVDASDMQEEGHIDIDLRDYDQDGDGKLNEEEFKQFTRDFLEATIEELKYAKEHPEDFDMDFD